MGHLDLGKTRSTPQKEVAGLAPATCIADAESSGAYYDRFSTYYYITAFAGWLSYLYSLLLIHGVLGATSTTTSITQLLAPGIRTGDHRIAPTEWLERDVGK